MKKVAACYQKEAKTINASGTNNLTDSTVVRAVRIFRT